MTQISKIRPLKEDSESEATSKMTTSQGTIAFQDVKGGASPVTRMFAGRSVFITGASGFIGRVLLEKLLRSYQGIERIYILMRPKKNMQPRERLHKQVLNVPIFDRIRSMRNGKELLDKIVVVEGDIGEPGLGISDEDLQMLISDQTLGVVFHSAATVKFDEPLRTAVLFNLVATTAIIELCKKLPNLISLCHVSTAYANSDIKDDSVIEEKIYPMSSKPEQLIKLAALMDENLMQQIKPMLVGERPNTYTYSKALGEQLVALEASELPVVIVRPSIVVAAWREPLPGWIDNLNGPTGLILAVGKGLLRTMLVSREAKADIIPVDIVVNTMIAAAYFGAVTNNKLPGAPALKSMPSIEPQLERKHTEECTSTGTHSGASKCASNNNNNNNEIKSNEGAKIGKANELPIFHCTSGQENPVTWGDMEKTLQPVIREYPSEQVLRYPFGTFKESKTVDLLTRILVHYLPALFIDLLCLIMGKKRQLLSIYIKLHSALSALSNFMTQNYNFKSDNIRLLEHCLTDEDDKRDLYMDIRGLNWASYWHVYVLGARRYVLKEEDHTLEKARRSFKKAYYYEIVFRTLLILLAIACCLTLSTRFGLVSLSASTTGGAQHLVSHYPTMRHTD